MGGGAGEKVLLGMKAEYAAKRGSLARLVKASESGENQFPPPPLDPHPQYDMQYSAGAKTLEGTFIFYLC